MRHSRFVLFVFVDVFGGVYVIIIIIIVIVVVVVEVV
jgi:hypothetical protein